MNCARACIVFLPAFCAAQPALAERTEEVTVVGQAAGTDLRAADEAKAEAEREAVKRACGSFINAQTQVANYQAVYDQVMSQAVGCIVSSEVLREWTDDEYSYCRLRAVVSTERFEQQWAAFAHTMSREDYPRCVIVVVEDDNLDDSIPGQANGAVQSVLENFFLGKNVRLMDKAQSDSVRQRDLELAAVNDDVDKLAAAAAAFKADVVILGSAGARPGGSISIAGHAAYKWDVSLSIRAIQTDAARILTSNVYRPDKAFTTTVTSGGSKALQELAEQSAPEVLSELGEAWRRQQVVSRICHVQFSPCTRKALKSIQAALGEVRGVQGGTAGVRIREFVNEVGDLEIDWAYELNMLADTIEDMQVEGMTFEVLEQTANRISVKVNEG